MQRDRNTRGLNHNKRTKPKRSTTQKTSPEPTKNHKTRHQQRTHENTSTRKGPETRTRPKPHKETRPRRRHHLLLKSGWYQYGTWVNRRLSLLKRQNQFRFTQKQSYMVMNKLFRAFDTQNPIRGWQSTRDENFYQLCSSFGSGLYSVLRDLLPPETLKKMQEPSLLEAFSAERESEYHLPFLFWEELRRR